MVDRQNIVQSFLWYNPYVKDDIDFLVGEYLGGKSAITISEENGVKINHLYKELKVRGLTRSNKENSRRYEVNHTYFSKIDGEDKAYWLGFLQTDGYITSRECKVGLALAEKDREHVELLGWSIGSTYPVHTYIGTGFSNNTKYCRLIISSEVMWNDLVRLGFTTNKTYDTKPIQVSSNLERHYIRGLMDGDGSLAISKTARSGFSGKFCSKQEGLCQYVADRLSNSGVIWFDKNKRMWYADFSLNEENMEYLYDNSTVYLRRKFDRAQLARQRLSIIGWRNK
jgi:hypothetical protein